MEEFWKMHLLSISKHTQNVLGIENGYNCLENPLK
jgi:hypothetical protein